MMTVPLDHPLASPSLLNIYINKLDEVALLMTEPPYGKSPPSMCNHTLPIDYGQTHIWSKCCSHRSCCRLILCIIQATLI